MDYVIEYERVAARLVRALDVVDPETPVPGCPGWSVADLALHIGGGERWAASILLSGREQRRPEVLRNVSSWPDWYEATAAALAAALRAVDPAEPCWNFAPVEQTAAFWSRRRTHEALIHLADVHQATATAEATAPGTVRPGAAGSDTAELSAVGPGTVGPGTEGSSTAGGGGSSGDGSGTGIQGGSGSEGRGSVVAGSVVEAARAVVPPELGADGVDEVFSVFLPRMLVRGAAPAVTRSISFRTTDTDHAWTLTPPDAADPAAPVVERGVVSGEAVVAGTAADLLLVLWNRLPAGCLTIDGDPAVARSFLAATRTP